MMPYLPKRQRDGKRISGTVELFIGARNLPNLDLISVTSSFLIIKLEQPDIEEMQILKTKTYSNNLNPNYTEPVTIDFIFEISQKLKFFIYRNTNPPQLIGKSQATLAEITGSPQGFRRNLINDTNSSAGQIFVNWQIVKRQIPNKILTFDLMGKNFPENWLCSFWPDQYIFRIYRLENQQQYLVFESQTGFNKDPQFRDCSISERRLCKNNQQENLSFRFYKKQLANIQQIGRTVITLNDIIDSSSFEIFKKKDGCFRFENIRRVQDNNFLDFIKAGLQFMLIICIDFTASNEPPNSPNSLHFVSETSKSPYEKALEQVSHILLDYDYDKEVPVYGFGAKVKMPTFHSNNKTHHCFPLNGNEDDAHVYMVQGIMNAYRTAIQYLEFDGPTYFNNILSQAIQECQRLINHSNQYMILFILTDGQIHDSQLVIDQIIKCCSLPISIIIVGIGDGDFRMMNKLNDNSCKLVDSKGNKTTRDLVTFVEFRKFCNNGILLARRVLDQLPRQVEQYFAGKQKNPSTLRRLQPHLMPVDIANRIQNSHRSRNPPQYYN